MLLFIVFIQTECGNGHMRSQMHFQSHTGTVARGGIEFFPSSFVQEGQDAGVDLGGGAGRACTEPCTFPQQNWQSHTTMTDNTRLSGLPIVCHTEQEIRQTGGSQQAPTQSPGMDQHLVLIMSWLPKHPFVLVLHRSFHCLLLT